MKHTKVTNNHKNNRRGGNKATAPALPVSATAKASAAVATLNLDSVQLHFNMPIHEASIALCVTEEELRFFCRAHGIKRYVDVTSNSNSYINRT